MIKYDFDEQLEIFWQRLNDSFQKKFAHVRKPPQLFFETPNYYEVSKKPPLGFFRSAPRTSVDNVDKGISHFLGRATGKTIFEIGAGINVLPALLFLGAGAKHYIIVEPVQDRIGSYALNIFSCAVAAKACKRHDFEYAFPLPNCIKIVKLLSGALDYAIEQDPKNTFLLIGKLNRAMADKKEAAAFSKEKDSPVLEFLLEKLGVGLITEERPAYTPGMALEALRNYMKSLDQKKIWLYGNNAYYWIDEYCSKDSVQIARGVLNALSRAIALLIPGYFPEADTDTSPRTDFLKLVSKHIKRGGSALFSEGGLTMSILLEDLEYMIGSETKPKIEKKGTYVLMRKK